MAQPRKRVRVRDRTKKGWKGDPLVPISPPWLQAVLAANRVTVAKLARQLGSVEQTIAHLAKGDTLKRTRASRRKAIAALLHVPEATLTGDVGYFPDERFGIEGGFSPLTWLASQSFLRRVDLAVQRDLEASAARSSLTVMSSHVVRSTIVDLLCDATRIDLWQRRLMPTGTLTDAQLYDAKDAGTLAMVELLERLLTPWFDGTRLLDYSAIIALTNVFTGKPDGRPMDPRAVLVGRYITADGVSL